MDELMALMKYMVGHNAAHARELADLAFKLDEAASGEMSLNDICHDILAHYMGSQPSFGDVQKLGGVIMNCLIDDFGIPFSRF